MTPIEEARVRVARADDEKRKLHEEIIERFGSIEAMGTYAQSAGSRGKKAADLRRRYNRAVKELKLAKSDLKRLRGEELAAPVPVDVEGTDDGIRIRDLPEEVAKDLGDHDAGKAAGPAPDRPAYMEAMEQAAEKAEASPKRPVQMDLEGKRAEPPLSGRIKVPPERFELETPTWMLKGPKDEMLEMVHDNQRTAVKARVQKGLRAKKDAIINDGDFDLAVERFVDEIMRGIIHRLPEDD